MPLSLSRRPWWLATPPPTTAATAATPTLVERRRSMLCPGSRSHQVHRAPMRAMWLVHLVRPIASLLRDSRPVSVVRSRTLVALARTMLSGRQRLPVVRLVMLVLVIVAMTKTRCCATWTTNCTFAPTHPTMPMSVLPFQTLRGCAPTMPILRYCQARGVDRRERVLRVRGRSRPANRGIGARLGVQFHSNSSSISSISNNSINNSHSNSNSSNNRRKRRRRQCLRRRSRGSRRRQRGHRWQ